MDLFFLIISICLVAIIAIPGYRVIKGPTVYDRLLAISGIGGKATVLICLAGLLFDRLDMFVDIALSYAILNFVGGIAVAKYFQYLGDKS